MISYYLIVLEDEAGGICISKSSAPLLPPAVSEMKRVTKKRLNTE
jgi:hypothetical protein